MQVKFMRLLYIKENHNDFVFLCVEGIGGGGNGVQSYLMNIYANLPIF